MQRNTAAFIVSALASSLAAAGPSPSAAQMAALGEGVISIVHFGLNTYADREWGYGDTPPSMFNPPSADPRQWVAAARDGGIRRIILVCKHHDGFCLWPSRHNSDYTVANSPWKGGRGDLVRETRDATISAGLSFGAYLSPWDRHRADYATPAYTEYFHRQWAELLDRYGPISEIWLDGANGGDGWYGGAKETRRIPSAPVYYDHPRLLAALKARPEKISVFGMNSDITLRWPGNEKGIIPEDWDAVRNGVFQPAEADTPLRGKWFWHRNDAPKSLETLVNCYICSVGRGGILNLGLAPDKRGLLADADVRRLREFGAWVAAFNATDLAKGSRLNVTQNADATVYAWSLPQAASFDAVELREDITRGLNIVSWRLSADGVFLAGGKQVGYRRITRLPAMTTARKVEVEVRTDGGKPRLALSLRRMPPISGAASASVRPAAAAIPFSDRSGQKRDVLVADFGPGGARVSGFVFTPPSDGRLYPKGWEAVVELRGGRPSKRYSGEFSNIKANPIPQEGEFGETLDASRISLRAIPFDGEKAAYPAGTVKFK